MRRRIKLLIEYEAIFDGEMTEKSVEKIKDNFIDVFASSFPIEDVDDGIVNVKVEKFTIKVDEEKT